MIIINGVIDTYLLNIIIKYFGNKQHILIYNNKRKNFIHSNFKYILRSEIKVQIQHTLFYFEIKHYLFYLSISKWVAYHDYSEHLCW